MVAGIVNGIADSTNYPRVARKVGSRSNSTYSNKLHALGQDFFAKQFEEELIASHGVDSSFVYCNGTAAAKDSNGMPVIDNSNLFQSKTSSVCGICTAIPKNLQCAKFCSRSRG